MKKIPQTALIACSRLVDFAGAEIASLELAEALRDVGVDVILAALEIGVPIEDELKILGIKYVDLSTTSIGEQEFDLLWASHYVVAYHLLLKEALKVKVGIYSSLSYFEPLETPPLSSLLFSHYTVNSEENYTYFVDGYPDLSERVSVFPNACPAKFFDAYSRACDNTLKSIAVISNHPPTEILELIGILRASGIDTNLIGIGGTQIRVTPEILASYSAVITIGKTVQYCFATGTPVFCYDRFGGPGWITLESFNAAKVTNFSGRCTPKRRTTQLIFEDILTSYSFAFNQRESLKNLAMEYFNLADNITNVIDIASNHVLSVSLTATDKKILSQDANLFVNLRHVIGNYHQTVVERDGQIASTNQALAERDGQIASINQALADRDGQISSISQALADRDGQIASINQALADRDGQIASSNQALIERDGQIASSNQALADREYALYLARGEFLSITESTSWKMTGLLRSGVYATRLLLSYLRTSYIRSRYVIRQDGILVFARKSVGYIIRKWQRNLAMKQLVHFVSDNESAVPKENETLVSFVIPIYDRTDVLRTTVKSALEQSVQVFEIILVTDGSPASTLAVVEEFRSDPRVRIFNYPISSGNAVRGRNKGILEARGRYIAFLDSDDIAAADRLEVCLPLLESDNADVVYGAWRALLDGSRDVDGLHTGQVVYSPDCDLAMLLKICVPCQSTVMVRRDLLLRTGFLKPRMKYREDHELWVRLANNGARFKAIPHVLTDLRLHAGNNELNFKTNDDHWESLINEEYHLLGPKPQKIAFLLSGLGISGGAAVVFKHVSMLMDQGHDAFIINLSNQGDISWYGNPSIRVYSLDEMPRCGLDNIDLLFATFWMTVDWLDKIPARRKLYLVQSDERLFYEDNIIKAQVETTYRRNYEYVVIAQWLVDMLRNEFGRTSVSYVPNGLDTNLFYPDSPLQDKNSQRLRVLIEGPISITFKGMVDAYNAVSELNCELWIVSSNGRPEQSWRYDRFFESVNQADMRRIYSSCDILLKMSRVESFAYPPLEAMACGCVVVLGDVKGGIEYAVDEKNVLKVPLGDVLAARTKVQRLLDDNELREKLKAAGFATAKLWHWEHSSKAMLDVIEAPV